MLAAWLGRELPDHFAVRDLYGGDVERRRQVDDEPVDLLVLQRLHRAALVWNTDGCFVGWIVSDDW